MKSLLKIGEMIDHCPVWLKDAIHNTCKEAGQKTDEAELHRRGHSEKAKVNQLDPTSRKSMKYVSVRTMDRDNEIVIPEGINLNEFRKYMHVLVNHNYSLLPVGSDESIEPDGWGIKATTNYADTGEGTTANILWHLISQGHLKSASIGFVPLEFTKPGATSWDHVANKLQSNWKEFDKEAVTEKASRIITKGVLLEHSDVSVPCNADAELIGVMKAYAPKLDEKVVKQLGWTMKDDDGITVVKLADLINESYGMELFPTMKPYPNEHASRQNDPDKYKRFARQNDKGGDGVHFIFGVKEDGSTELQAVRFDKSKFTPEQAKAWLKEHKMKEALEEAKEEKVTTLRDPSTEKPPFNCECVECGHKIKSEEKHCTEIKCPECGGQMRREERPGIGRKAAGKKQECEDLSESIGKKLVSLIRREVEVEDLIDEKEKLDKELDNPDEDLLEKYEALVEKVNDKLAGAKGKVVKVLRQPESIKVLYAPPREEQIAEITRKAVETAMARKLGRVL